MPIATPWVATYNSFGGKPQPFKWTIFFKGFYAVLRAGRCKPAPTAKPGGYY